MKIIIYISLLIISLNATSIRDSVEKTINTNPDIIMESFNKRESASRVKKEEKGYYPTLDFDSTYEKVKLTDNKNDKGKSITSKSGMTAKLTLEQVLYDGQKQRNTIQKEKHSFLNIKYNGKEKIENLILDTIKVYLKLVSYQEIIAINNYKIKIHNKYLKLAKEKKDLSGEVLDYYQVMAKIQTLEDKTLEEKVNKQKALSEYKKLTGEDLSGYICRPKINEKLLPTTLKKLIDNILESNNKIRAQKELVRQQTSKYYITKSSFKPIIKLIAKIDRDKDLVFANNGTQDTQTMKIQSTWNLYSGTKDTISSQIERINILKEKKKLDSIKNSEIDRIKGAYNSYFELKKRIINLKALNITNKTIVDVYKQQLSDGTRTFLDLLSAETELFRTTLLLKDIEFDLYNEYYFILNSLNMLSDSVLMEKNQVCKPYIFDESIFKSDVAEDDAELLLLDGE